ncbi:SLC13 family permease [Aminicella lysinilytica]|uniref:Putative tyrosine transporter P-protein n=1 Tax=Aminicella lysinilytica TaxID=433323 RepID=A0A4R6QCU8_9FIRM|nr:ArsB/NhaD family transporter [Aminicella lysinilytica]TDP59776.1 putative tyrosine transporter P-protein [Aminicella lysinilytica]
MNQEVVSIIIFVAVITVIMTEKVHRTAAALAGTVALLLTGILTVDEAIGYVDFNTIGVLVGMMLFVAVVKHSGLFEYVSIKSAKMAKGDPWKIMVVFMIITAVCSALLDNVTTVLLMGPMTLTMAQMLRINPVPILLGQIFASNIGGTMTLIGDPPNIMIGSAANLSFMDFVENTGVACTIGLIVIIFFMKVAYKKKLSADADAVKEIMELDENKAITDPKLMKISIAMIVLIVVAFVIHGKIGIESSAVALTAAAIMMIIGHQDIDEVVSDVEWPTLLFFICLFIVVGGMVKTGVISQLANLIMDFSGGHLIMTMMILLWASAFLSAILDNIPFVATLIPLILAMGQQGMDITPLWWAISLGACLGGNGTQIGASANVVLSGISGRHGYPISFKDYTKVGMPVMIITVTIAMIFLLLKYQVGLPI